MPTFKTSGPIRIGLVGIGRAGWGMHTNELKERDKKFIFVASHDVDASRTAKMADDFGAKAYPTYKALLADSNVEMVSIASPSPFHTEQALQALAAGKFVFLEKPIALSFADAKKLKAAATKYKGKLFFRHNRRFEKAFQHIREIIASGVLGEIYSVKLHRHSYQRRDDWQTLIGSGGGQLNNWGPHIVDHALHFLEAPVAEIWSNLKKIAAVGDAEDHLKIILRGKNDRVVEVEISGGAALPQPEYVIFGTKGALTCHNDQIQMKYLDPMVKLAPRKASKATPPMEGSFGQPDKLVWKEEILKVSPKTGWDTDAIWDHLHEAIREGKKFPITADEAVEVVRIIEEVKRGTAFAGKKK